MHSLDMIFFSHNSPDCDYPWVEFDKPLRISVTLIKYIPPSGVQSWERDQYVNKDILISTIIESHTQFMIEGT